MITTQAQYHAVSSRIEQIKDAEPDTPEAMELKLLTKLIVEYETQRPTASPEQSQKT